MPKASMDSAATVNRMLEVAHALGHVRDGGAGAFVVFVVDDRRNAYGQACWLDDGAIWLEVSPGAPDAGPGRDWLGAHGFVPPGEDSPNFAMPVEDADDRGALLAAARLLLAALVEIHGFDPAAGFERTELEP